MNQQWSSLTHANRVATEEESRLFNKRINHSCRDTGIFIVQFPITAIKYSYDSFRLHVKVSWVQKQSSMAEPHTTESEGYNDLACAWWNEPSTKEVGDKLDKHISCLNCMTLYWLYMMSPGVSNDSFRQCAKPSERVTNRPTILTWVETKRHAVRSQIEWNCTSIMWERD